MKAHEKCFLYHLKVLFVLKIFNFCPDFFGHAGKRLVISNFMTSQTGKPIVTIHILPNISRSTGNQTIKFGQLIEYNVKNIRK